MTKPITLIVLIATLLTSCGPASLPPPTTASVTPSTTPFPTQTAIPTATPYPSLQTDGPYLLFQGDNQTLVMMDADGIGRKYIQIPKNAYIPRFENAVSPNGEWLAYFTGSTQKPYDLGLNLINLENESTVHITNLLSAGYPENLEPITKLISFGEYETDCSNSIECKLRIIESEIRTGIYYFDWSPNSEEIAFAAQIDGPSSDVYIYSLEENSIRRLTNEPENIGLMIDWAPNGEKILYSSTESNTIYSFYPLHIADPINKSPQNPKIIDRGVLFWFGEGWINENSYLLWDGGEGAPPHRLRIINIDTQEVKQIWEYSAESFFVDLQKKLIILSPYGRIYLDPEVEAGIYVISFDGISHKAYDEVVYFIKEQTAINQYIAITQQNQLVSVKLDGSITNLHRKPDYDVAPQSSPDGKWIIITNETETEIYSREMQLVKSLGIHATEIIWRQDSSGVFLSSYPNLYYVSMNDKELELVNICPLENCSSSDYVWLP